jgi:hypothetical protein
MKKNLLSFLLITFFATSFLAAQNTVGLLSYQPSKAYDGFNLIFPHNQPNVYLLDNCGEVVNVWEDEANFRPGNTVYLRPDGSIVKTKRDAAVATDPIWAGGGGAIIEIRDWDNNLTWSYELNNETNRLHHDIAIVENDSAFTILAIAWELKTEAECLQAGRDTSNTAQDKLWPDYVFEINPLNDEIIWEWYVWDHLIQDFDDTKDNFGVVADHPELIDVNYDTHDGHPDWLHANSLDYHQGRDQIMLSIPYFNEVWIIDHTTTTAQAASSNGGLSGKGGDLMYRWGNPAAYQQGTADDQTLFFQHDAHWNDDFLNFTNDNWEQIVVFNNRVGVDFSQVNVFDPAWDMYSWVYDETGGPDNYLETVQHPEDPTELFSTGLSSAQYLPNGNVLITSGRFGYSFEVTPDDEIVWEYKTPLVGGAPATQGDTLAINNNLTFRMNRYPADYEAFEGRDMTGKSWLELEPDEQFCDLILPVGEAMSDYYLKVYPNPVSNRVTIEWEGGLYADVMIYDILGRKKDSFRASGGRKYLDVSNYEPGIYFIEIEGRQVTRLIKN